VLLNARVHHFSLSGRYLVVVVASSPCYTWSYIYSHSCHLKLFATSPSFVSQPNLEGSCKELDLKDLAKAFLALVSVDNDCSPFHSSPVGVLS
jgi:hypothetical protein